MLIDTHAHLQWASFNKDREKVIERAREAGVKRIVNIGFDIKGSQSAVRQAESHMGLYATVGVHPHNASQLGSVALNELKKLAESSKVVAIGEIGLDYYRDLSPRDVQRRAFEAQLSLAEELDLPVVVHNREAHTETLNALSDFRGRGEIIMHCFSGSSGKAEEYIGLGFYLSFAGTVTFPNAHSLRETVARVDLGRMLIETDSPWLAPQRVRGRRNEPAFLPFIAEEIAKLKGISIDELAKATTENANEVFQLGDTSRS
ncbi:MAG: TatD family hydrolase [Candidatus Bathyarchaeota archaeon]|nr:MAG: TatD family hydrolase [Candidatus Bathyarchaeota archaeon]